MGEYRPASRSCACLVRQHPPIRHSDPSVPRVWRPLGRCTILKVMTESKFRPPKQVYESEGRLWTPKPDATSTFEENVAARAAFIEINDDARWNPWVREDRATEERSAMAVMGQWTRAEFGFLQMTDQEAKEMLDEVGRRSDAESAADAARQERDKERYDRVCSECAHRVRHLSVRCLKSDQPPSQKTFLYQDGTACSSEAGRTPAFAVNHGDKWRPFHGAKCRTLDCQRGGGSLRPLFSLRTASPQRAVPPGLCPIRRHTETTAPGQGEGLHSAIPYEPRPGPTRQTSTRYSGASCHLTVITGDRRPENVRR